MRNFMLSIIIIAVVCAALQIFLPWYIIAVVAFAAGYAIKQGSFATFVSGFLAVFILWVGYAAMLSHNNGNLLAHKVAELLPLGGHVVVLLLITGFIGGLVSGLAALSGRLLASV